MAKHYDIKERTFAFAMEIISVTNNLNGRKTAARLGNQLLRAGTSVGANVEEAVASYSREEYSYKMNIGLKEARETMYWLRLIKEANLCRAANLNELIQETDEIARVLGSIVSKLRKKS